MFRSFIFNLTRVQRVSFSTQAKFVESSSENDGLVRRITLSNPKKRNVLSLDTLKQLNDEFEDVASCKDVRAVILAAKGPVFSSGHDLVELANASDVKRREIFQSLGHAILKMRHLQVPVIARVHAYAAAGGCQLVCGADIVLALDSASFSTPGIQLGLFCSTPGVMVSRQVPDKVAMDMLITGRPISALDALRAGLISRIVQGGQEHLDHDIDRLTTTICSYGRESLTIGKRAFYAQRGLNLPEALETASYAMVENINTDDFLQGVAKFMAKKVKKDKSSSDWD